LADRRIGRQLGEELGSGLAVETGDLPPGCAELIVADGRFVGPFREQSGQERRRRASPRGVGLPAELEQQLFDSEG